MIGNTARALVPVELRRQIARIMGRDVRPRVRRYIPAGVGVEAFFRSLERASVRCVVLRWFDDLPQMEPGEDIDMLIADEDLPKVSERLDNYSGGVPCDIYTVQGAVGSQYKGHPYYPLVLAERLIERRHRLQGIYPVPSAEDYFYSLAYHAVYHKGPFSGLSTDLPGVVVLNNPEHDYAGILSKLRDRLGLNVEISLDALDNLLASIGYRPSLDVLRVLSGSNTWAKEKFFE